MKKQLLLVCFTSTIIGCMSSGLKVSSGTNVKEKSTKLPVTLINTEMAKQCTFIGVANGHVYNAFQYTSDNISDARLKAANEALSSGANSVVITSTDVQQPGHNVTVNMETYKCP